MTNLRYIFKKRKYEPLKKGCKRTNVRYNKKKISKSPLWICSQNKRKAWLEYKGKYDRNSASNRKYHYMIEVIKKDSKGNCRVEN